MYFILFFFYTDSGLLWWPSGKESFCQRRSRGFDPWVGTIPWRSKWQPSLVFLPGEFCRQRRLAGYSPCGGRVGHGLATEHAVRTRDASWKHQAHADFEVFAPSVPSRFQNVLCLQGSLPRCTQVSAQVPCISGSSLTLHPPAPFPYPTSISSQRLFILTDGGSSHVTLFCLPLSGKEKAGTRSGPSLLCPQHPEEGLDPNRHSTSISLTAVEGISHITQLTSQHDAMWIAMSSRKVTATTWNYRLPKKRAFPPSVSPAKRAGRLHFNLLIAPVSHIVLDLNTRYKHMETDLHMTSR